jgi:hypothetical protein
MAKSSAAWSSTLMYYISTTQGYTYVSDVSTLIISYYNSYSETNTYRDFFTFIDTVELLCFNTDVQYSTITRMIAPSPSPIKKCTCVFPLCNRIDLVLLTINNIV